MKTLAVVYTDFCSEDLAVARDSSGTWQQWHVTAVARDSSGTWQQWHVTAVEESFRDWQLRFNLPLSVANHWENFVWSLGNVERYPLPEDVKSSKSDFLQTNAEAFLSCKLGTGIAAFTRGLNVKHSQKETLHGVTYGIMSACIFVVLFVKSKVVSLSILLLQSLLMQTVYSCKIIVSYKSRRKFWTITAHFCHCFLVSNFHRCMD